MTAEHSQEQQTTSTAANEAAGDASHASHAAAASAPPASDIPFTSDEITGFDNDDSLAGRALGKLLSSFFLYTVIVMAVVAWWTFSKLP